ncbi:hypothetical protein BDR06DRAFT_966754 [Suillus hirtellus]|nr:hypothetical protein BDR06DRAFT_966754 [Suillus hirtellus]
MACLLQTKPSSTTVGVGNLELQDPKIAEADKERKKRNQRDKRARDRSKVQEEGPWPMVLDLTGDVPTFNKGLTIRLHHTDSPSAKIFSEVPPTEDVVQWPNGQTTVLPTVMRDGRNVCEGDAKYVRQLATLPLSMPGSHHVEHIDPIGMNDADLCQRVEETLRGGRCAVVRGAAKPGPEKLTAEYLVERGIPPWLRTTHHGRLKHTSSDTSLLTLTLDIEQRAIGKVHPCIDATIDQLLSGANDPKELRCALDIPLPACTLPQPFQLLDHTFVCAWAHTMRILPFHKTRLHPDLLLYRRWANIYQGGTLTLPQHTSNGFGMSFSVDRFLSRDQMIDQFLALYEINYDHPQLPDGLEAEIVDLHPGDLLYVSTKHSCHLWSLFLDNSHGKTYTGQERKGTFVTLRRMMAALPYMPLTLMILDPISYISQQRDSETLPLSHKTKTINKTIKVVSGEAVGVLDDSAWDAVGDQPHVEKVWDNSNAIESNDSL